MFDQEAVLNQFLMAGLRRIVDDIPNDRLGERAPGNGHPPVWVLGHLAICGELGRHAFDRPLEHPEWIATFGPGSSDEISNAQQYDKSELGAQIERDYLALGSEAQGASLERVVRPHGVMLLDGTPIKTTGHLLSHLLTSHFSFHLAQLSAWRRAAGHGPLF